ncbi:ATP-binding cassette domain-containing protein [Granulosicoccus sp.]|nr:ATP-binding cassette domain-containing protein [Granulosicoccus sp.]MDB4224036.1 ATP-binding cassette domain-containing protein [Granulosicoccus sp.]
MLTLKDVDVRLAERQWCFDIDLNTHGIYALLGRSGSGKSTLLNVIAGFLKASSGAIAWQEQPLNNLEPAQRPVTTLFQDHNLFSHLTVLQNIGLGISPNLKLQPEQTENLHAVLENVGLTGYEKKLPGSLSGGEQQRVALARCLLRRQPILLLDEPFSALDATTRQEMITLLQEVIDSYKPCVLMVTHDEADADALSASILRMKSDRIELSE